MTSRTTSDRSTQQPGQDWQREYAYTLGEQAYIYGFPYVYNAMLRYDWVTQPPKTELTPHSAVNHFWHARVLFDDSDHENRAPNNDTLYSAAWVDLSTEPVILSHPEMGDRYFTFELVGMTSDNYGYVGQRVTGSHAGHFALVGPGWSGKLPEGIRETAVAPTPWILVLGRTLVEGEADLPAVRKLQDQYRLTPLSMIGKQGLVVPERRDVLEPAASKGDPLAWWKTLNAMLAENPPSGHHELLLKQFAAIGVGPGLDVAAQPESVRQGLIAAAAAGLPVLEQQFQSGDWATLINGWRYPPRQMGRFGDDFIKRAAEQAMFGVAANDLEEAMYLVAFDDADGARLSTGRFELRFEPGGQPPVDAFWSLTAYGEDRNLIGNPINRYSIGDRTPGLVTGPDGSLTVSMRPDSPGPDQEANWLPIPRKGGWFVMLRMYLPRREAIDAKWQCPSIKRLS